MLIFKGVTEANYGVDYMATGQYFLGNGLVRVKQTLDCAAALTAVPTLAPTTSWAPSVSSEPTLPLTLSPTIVVTPAPSMAPTPSPIEASPSPTSLPTGTWAPSQTPSVSSRPTAGSVCVDYRVVMEAPITQNGEGVVILIILIILMRRMTTDGCND